MGIGKQRASLGKSIDVRCQSLRMASQTADPIIQVVDGNQEDIGAFIGLRSRTESDQ